MPALASRVQAVIAQRADPRAAEEQRLAAWLAELPTDERRRLQRAYIADVDGRPTAVVEFLLIPRLHREALTPWHVSSFSREISPDLWYALNNNSSVVGMLTAEEAAAIKFALGELPRRWCWPDRWFSEGRLWLYRLSKYQLVTMPIDSSALHSPKTTLPGG